MNKILASFFVVLVSSASESEAYELINDGYKSYSRSLDGTWKLHLIPATWHDARLRCHFEGGVLASPVNGSFLAAMRDVLTDTKMFVPTIFTGIHATFSKGDFSSVEGVPLSVMKVTWGAREPNIVVNNEDCLAMDGTGDNLFSTKCTNLHPYICFRPNTYDDFDIRCRLGVELSKGYSYDSRTGSCYKVHTEGQTWERGYKACAAELAHLVIINSPLEAQVIKELLEKYPKNSMQATYTHVASVGFHDWGQRGSWWTIHGETLPDAGYAVWDIGAPDGRQTQFCGGINRSGKFNDVPCKDGSLPFICEKTRREPNVIV